jgi:hypothetical protein
MSHADSHLGDGTSRALVFRLLTRAAALPAICVDLVRNRGLLPWLHAVCGRDGVRDRTRHLLAVINVLHPVVTCVAKHESQLDADAALVAAQTILLLRDVMYRAARLPPTAAVSSTSAADETSESKSGPSSNEKQSDVRAALLESVVRCWRAAVAAPLLRTHVTVQDAAVLLWSTCVGLDEAQMTNSGTAAALATAVPLVRTLPSSPPLSITVATAPLLVPVVAAGVAAWSRTEPALSAAAVRLALWSWAAEQVQAAVVLPAVESAKRLAEWLPCMAQAAAAALAAGAPVHVLAPLTLQLREPLAAAQWAALLHPGADDGESRVSTWAKVWQSADPAGGRHAKAKKKKHKRDESAEGEDDMAKRAHKKAKK